jgi:hypothetical protein
VVPRLDPPFLYPGVDMSSRDKHPSRRRPVVLAALTFVVAMVATVLVLLATGALAT